MNNNNDHDARGISVALPLLFRAAFGFTMGLYILPYVAIAGQRLSDALNESGYGQGSPWLTPTNIGLVYVLLMFVVEWRLEVWSGAIGRVKGTRFAMAGCFSLRALYFGSFIVMMTTHSRVVVVAAALVSIASFATSFTLFSGNYEQWLQRQAAPSGRAPAAFAWSMSLHWLAAIAGCLISLIFLGNEPITRIGAIEQAWMPFLIGLIISVGIIAFAARSVDDTAPKPPEGPEQEPNRSLSAILKSAVGVALAVVLASVTYVGFRHWGWSVWTFGGMLFLARLLHGYVDPKVQDWSSSIASKHSGASNALYSIGEKYKKVGALFALSVPMAIGPISGSEAPLIAGLGLLGAGSTMAIIWILTPYFRKPDLRRSAPIDAARRHEIQGISDAKETAYEDLKRLPFLRSLFVLSAILYMLLQALSVLPALTVLTSAHDANNLTLLDKFIVLGICQYAPALIGSIAAARRSKDT